MPVKIARSTPQPSFGLPELLVAGHISRLASRDATLHAGFGVIRGMSVKAVPLGSAPAAAAVDTDVEAGPGVDRIVGRPRLVVGRQLGGRRRPSRQRQ